MSEVIGGKFGLLTAVEVVGRNKRGLLIKCICECGNEKNVNAKELRSGNNKSCGCLNHGMTGTRIYIAWTNMKRRCNDPNNKQYHNYGGRGITYVAEWEEFMGFYKDMKVGYSDNLTLDRIDLDGDYSLVNCRWADKETQANNTSTNRFITYKGETLTMSQTARKHGLTPDFLKQRLYLGWTVEDAIEKPVEYEEITYNGETKTVSVWAEEKGLTYHQLKKRLMRGWTVERAIEQPLRKRSK